MIPSNRQLRGIWMSLRLKRPDASGAFPHPGTVREEFRAYVVKTKAEALREAADAHEREHGEKILDTALPTPTSRWLRARAEYLEGTLE